MVGVNTTSQFYPQNNTHRGDMLMPQNRGYNTNYSSPSQLSGFSGFNSTLSNVQNYNSTTSSGSAGSSVASDVAPLSLSPATEGLNVNSVSGNNMEMMVFEFMRIQLGNDSSTATPASSSTPGAASLQSGNSAYQANPNMQYLAQMISLFNDAMPTSLAQSNGTSNQGNAAAVNAASQGGSTNDSTIETDIILSTTDASGNTVKLEQRTTGTSNSDNLQSALDQFMQTAMALINPLYAGNQSSAANSANTTSSGSSSTAGNNATGSAGSTAATSTTGSSSARNTSSSTGTTANSGNSSSTGTTANSGAAASAGNALTMGDYWAERDANYTGTSGSSSSSSTNNNSINTTA
ncbi:MAG: hypothetical protein HQK89_02150 [Nitrospirae bacterium]|nr:hypothetical protein [Nitrospirota bacterium]